MAKQDEIDYPVRFASGMAHGAAKPFSDPRCGQYLIRLGTLMSLFPPAPARILDLGCGPGWTSRFYARAGYDVVGVDIAPEMIRLANESRDAENLPGLSFVVSDYETLSFHEEFDAAVFFDSLHHADDEGLAIRKAFAALKPGGVLLTDEPGMGHSTSADALAAVAKYGVTEKDMPPERIVELGRAAGFEAFRVFPSPEALTSVVYTDRTDSLPEPFATTDPAVEQEAATGLRRVYHRAANRLRPVPTWRLRGFEHLLLYIRENGLVLMRKGAQSAQAAA